MEVPGRELEFQEEEAVGGRLAIPCAQGSMSLEQFVMITGVDPFMMEAVAKGKMGRRDLKRK